MTVQESVSLRTISIRAFYASETVHCVISAFCERHNMVIYVGYVTFQELIHGRMRSNLKDR